MGRIEASITIKNMKQVNWICVDVPYSLIGNSECCICYKDGDSKILDCNHIICLYCTTMLSEFVKNKCPYCRSHIRIIERHLRT